MDQIKCKVVGRKCLFFQSQQRESKEMGLFLWKLSFNDEVLQSWTNDVFPDNLFYAYTRRLMYYWMR